MLLATDHVDVFHLDAGHSVAKSTADFGEDRRIIETRRSLDNCLRPGCWVLSLKYSRTDEDCLRDNRGSTSMCPQR